MGNFTATIGRLFSGAALYPSEKTLARFAAGSLRRLDFNRLRGTKPIVNREALVRQYVHWVAICSEKNANAVADSRLRLFATSSRGQRQVRGYCNPRPITKALRQDLESRGHLAKLKNLANAADVVEITQHPFLDLMCQVNPHMNQWDLMELTQKFTDNTGDSFWLIEKNNLGTPENIWYLRSQWMRIVPDKVDLIKGYMFGRDHNRQEALSVDEVVHFKRANMSDPLWGMGVLEPSIRAALRYTAMDTYEQALNENMGIPSMVVGYKGRLSKEQRKELEISWDQQMAGVRRAGKTVVADIDFDLKELGVTPREMGFLQGRKWTRLEIADAFGVPLALLDTESVNRANAESALLQYARFTIKPALTRIEQKINEKIMPMYDDRLFVAFDNPVPEDKEFQLKVDESDKKNGIRTTNEIRLSRNIEPIDGGDTLLVPSGFTPILQLISEPEPPPSAPDSVFQFNQDGSCCKIHRKAPRPEDVGLPMPEMPGGISGGPNPALSKNERKIKKGVEGAWVEQRRLLDAQVEELGQAVIAEAMDAKIFAEAIREPITSELGNGARTALADLEGAGRTFSIPDFVLQPQTRQFIDDKLFQVANKITDDLATELTVALTEGIEGGETIRQLKNRIELTGDEFIGKRAEMIARTESARMNMGGRDLAWQESGVVAAKKWDAAGDACPFCQEMDGKTVSLGENFIEQGAGLAVFVGEGDKASKITLPTDFDAIPTPPIHPNCRCALTPVLIEV